MGVNVTFLLYFQDKELFWRDVLTVTLCSWRPCTKLAT